MFKLLKSLFGTSQERQINQFRPIVAKINQIEEKLSSLSDQEIQEKTAAFKQRYQNGETLDQLLPEAYALVKNVCRRMIGQEIHVSGYDQKWDMIPYDVQILGAIAMHKGYISEMQTGEGKTVTATMPLYLNALTSKSVHLVTVNDYLASRDCEWVGSILRRLGLTTAVLTNETPPHVRKAIYNADVVYGTASEFGFDYLRDNSMAQHAEEQVQRGYYFAIIDEVDSILIDEARTPLIISGPVPNSRQMYGELKDATHILVKKQRDLCNQIATEAKRILEPFLSKDEIAPTKEEKIKINEACRKLWVVNKGMPMHKILRRVKEHPDLRAYLEEWNTYFHNDQNKEEKLELLASLYLVVDEKGNEFELSDKGIAAWAETPTGSEQDFVMIDMGEGYRLIDQNMEFSEEEKIDAKIKLGEEDALRKEKAHNLRQLLRGHLLMEKDIDYIVADNKIVIIDENTGRPQPGRRFSDGLHQAIEAKEGVKIQKETQTFASITLQNYFRMYEKLAGMTGTAITEAREFEDIYKLKVLQIPTFKKCIRHDFNDEIYMTEREKYQAILQEIKKVQQEKRPILIGTDSVETSEKLSRILSLNKIPHTVLNAKNHANEAEIIADAGKESAVTVATNMAGRGTDIKLQGESAKRGGLHVIGTTRHQSRRTDRQLRGRSARLGDPGSSKFYISFEDSLMRLFASPRLSSLIQRFRPPEGEPISANILNRSIETAQKRVEGRNYTMRKHTLEYDDVMNKQRQEIYSFRNMLLHNSDIIQEAKELLRTVCFAQSEKYLGTFQERDPDGFRQWLMNHFPVTVEEDTFHQDLQDAQTCEEIASSKVIAAFEKKIAQLNLENHTEEQMLLIKRDALASLMLHKVDEIWQEHLLTMDHLRTEVSLRSVGQKDPLLEFKHEAFKLFHDLTEHLSVDIATSLFKLGIRARTPESFATLLTQLNLNNDPFFLGNPDEVQLPSAEMSNQISPLNLKHGRNHLCPCNSGKKYKKCCGINSD